MKLGIIAGNRTLPILLSRRIKKERNVELIAFAFYGETSKEIKKYADKVHWLRVGELLKLKLCLERESIRECLMAGQISPLRIFNRKNWDEALISLVRSAGDFRPHTIFSKIIEYLSKEGVAFLDSTLYLQDDLAAAGVMNSIEIEKKVLADIDFGLDIISRYVELDVGQTIVVKDGGVVCLESLEGTDRAIKRGYSLGKKGCTILKFSKSNQDMRFDVPVVGISTLKLLRRIRAASLILEAGKVIILDKDKFLSLARLWNIPVFGLSIATR
jgi:UDP-2,3-diacylglucosamine hydrolase